jgi:hypothetical protein
MLTRYAPIWGPSVTVAFMMSFRKPVNLIFPYQCLEFRVAGDQFGFAVLGQRGGEGVPTSNFMCIFPLEV